MFQMAELGIMRRGSGPQIGQVDQNCRSCDYLPSNHPHPSQHLPSNHSPITAQLISLVVTTNPHIISHCNIAQPMKQHNQLVRFKNAFASSPQKKEQLTSILSEDMTAVVADKLHHVAELYRAQVAHSDYDPAVAFRVITLCLLTNGQAQINLFEELTRIFRHSAESKQLENIQLCFDLLLLKQTKDVLTEQQLRVLKVRLLRALRMHYQKSKNKQSLKKCRLTLEEYCKASLQRDRVKHNPQIYKQIMDSLIDQVKLKINRLVKHKNAIGAIQQMVGFVGVLERSEQIVSTKYQFELMSAYCTLAHLHHMLHYVAYTRKYASIALNIAERLQNEAAINQLKLLLEGLI